MSKNKSYPIYNPINIPRLLREGLEEANQLLINQKPQEALAHLLKLDHKYPHNPEILESMAFAYVDLKNNYGYLNTMLQLNALVSDREFFVLGLANAYLANGFQALAYKTFRELYKRWPRSENAPNTQKIIQQLEIFVIETSSKLAFSLEPGLDFFSKHEEIQLLMNQKKFKRCKQLAKELLNLRPKFAPVHNNLSQITWLEGNLTEAIEITQSVLDFQPDNVHALSTLCCYLFMQGKEEKAFKLAKRLKESKILASDYWVKKAKALSFIGDDDGVITLMEQAKQDQKFKLIDGTFWHWCAVAEYRKGNLSRARTYWNKCNKLAPFYSLAIENLEELKKPVFDRNCPKAFGLDVWLPEKIIEDISAIIKHPSNQKKNNGFNINLGSYLAEHPEILQFIPAAITAGDTFTRELAMQLAEIVSNPVINNWLTSYALGKEGPDALRLKAAQILTKHGIFKTGKKVKLWSKGELRPVLMFGFEIIFESLGKETLRPSARKLMEEAIEAIKEGNGKKAENFLRKAIEIQPNEPSLLNNLAVSLQLQRKISEVNALADQIEKSFPDYFFGQLIAARKAVSVKDFNKAQLILNKLMKKDELHITEFSALCACQIDFHMADRNLEGAISWLQIWEEVYPEDTSLGKYQELKNMTKLYSRGINGNFNRRRKKK